MLPRPWRVSRRLDPGSVARMRRRSIVPNRSGGRNGVHDQIRPGPVTCRGQPASLPERPGVDRGYGIRADRPGAGPRRLGRAARPRYVLHPWPQYAGRVQSVHRPKGGCAEQGGSVFPNRQRAARAPQSKRHRCCRSRLRACLRFLSSAECAHPPLASNPFNQPLTSTPPLGGVSIGSLR